MNELSETLNASQRRARAIEFRREAPKIALGRERAKRTFANPEKLKDRARHEARSRMFSKLAKGVQKSDLSFDKRAQIEKRMSTPAAKIKIERLAMKLLKSVRDAEIARHSSHSSEGTSA